MQTPTMSYNVNKVCCVFPKAAEELTLGGPACRVWSIAACYSTKESYTEEDLFWEVFPLSRNQKQKWDKLRQMFAPQ